MLMAGNKHALMLFGFSDPENIGVESQVFDKPALSIGEVLNFSFQLLVNEPDVSKTRLEYAL